MQSFSFSTGLIFLGFIVTCSISNAIKMWKMWCFSIVNICILWPWSWVSVPYPKSCGYQPLGNIYISWYKWTILLIYIYSYHIYSCNSVLCVIFTPPSPLFTLRIMNFSDTPCNVRVLILVWKAKHCLDYRESKHKATIHAHQMENVDYNLRT